MRLISIAELLNEAGIRDTSPAEVMAAVGSPNPAKLNPSPGYIACLLDRSGLSESEVAELLDIPLLEMRAYARGSACPYPIQYCLEVLAWVTGRRSRS